MLSDGPRGCQTIGESHSGDTETLWHDGYRFIRSRARSAFGNYSLPIRFNCLFELGASGFRGTHRPTCLAASTLSLGVLCGRRGHGRLVYIKYTWSIGNCTTSCYIPAPSSCRSFLAFNL